MNIRYGFHGADLIGPLENESRFDLPESAARYAAQVEECVQAHYPEADDVTVVYDLDASGAMPQSLKTMVDDDPTHEEIDTINHLAALVFGDYKWCALADKTFTVISGSRYNPVHAEVTLNGFRAIEAMTPAMAARAARVGCGHRNGVTVWSNDDHGYRLYADSTRRVKRDA